MAPKADGTDSQPAHSRLRKSSLETADPRRIKSLANSDCASV